MNFGLQALTNPQAFAEQFNKLQAEKPPLDTPLAQKVLSVLRTGPATWWRLKTETGVGNLDLDTALTHMIAAGQVCLLPGVGQNLYGLPDATS